MYPVYTLIDILKNNKWVKEPLVTNIQVLMNFDDVMSTYSKVEQTSADMQMSEAPIMICFKNPHFPYGLHMHTYCTHLYA